MDRQREDANMLINPIKYFSGEKMKIIKESYGKSVAVSIVYGYKKQNRATSIIYLYYIYGFNLMCLWSI